MIRLTPVTLILLFLNVNIYKKKSEMHVTTRRSYLDKYNESIFYSKRHISLTVVPARWVSIALLHPLLTLLSKLKASKLKKTEKPGKMFYMAFLTYTTV